MGDDVKMSADTQNKVGVQNKELQKKLATASSENEELRAKLKAATETTAFTTAPLPEYAPLLQPLEDDGADSLATLQVGVDTLLNPVEPLGLPFLKDEKDGHKESGNKIEIRFKSKKKSVEEDKEKE